MTRARDEEAILRGLHICEGTPPFLRTNEEPDHER